MDMVTLEETLQERTLCDGDGEAASQKRRGSASQPQEDSGSQQDTHQKDGELEYSAAATSAECVDVDEKYNAGISGADQLESGCDIESTQWPSSGPRNKTPCAEVEEDLEVTEDTGNKAETQAGGGEGVEVKDTASNKEKQGEADTSTRACPNHHNSTTENLITSQDRKSRVQLKKAKPLARRDLLEEEAAEREGTVKEETQEKHSTTLASVKGSHECQENNWANVQRPPSVHEEPTSPIWIQKPTWGAKETGTGEKHVEGLESLNKEEEEELDSGAANPREKELDSQQTSKAERSKKRHPPRGLKELTSGSNPGVDATAAPTADALPSNSSESPAAGGGNGTSDSSALNHSSAGSSDNPPPPQPQPPQPQQQQLHPGSPGRGEKQPLQRTHTYTEYVAMPKQGLDRQLSGWSVQSDQFEGTENQLLVLLRQGKGGLNQLKKFLRKNHWPTDHAIRHTLWASICRYLYKAEGDLYDEMVKELFTAEDLEEEMEVPLPPFVEHGCLTNYHLSERGVALTTRVVAIINHMHPDITYSPTTYALACLFLHYMGASDCFNCVTALLKCKEQKFLTQTKVATEVSKLVMRDLAKKHAKSAYVFLVRQSSNVDLVFENWIWWIFKDLPFSHVVRVIDCFLCEGIKVLYRVALAILKLFAKHSGKKSREPDSVIVANNISRFCERMPVDVSKLLKEAFRIRNFTRAEISRLEMKHEVYVKSRAVLGNAQDMPRVLSVQSMSGVSMSKAFSGPSFMAHAKSSILSPDMTHTLWGWLPVRFGVCQPYLLFTTEEHGTSLRTLYARVEHAPQTLIIIKTTTGEVFGAFCSSAWSERTSHGQNLSYFGTGETFIFSLRPEKMKYEWVGLLGTNISNTSSMFLAGDNSVMTIGGGKGEAIKLDEDMNRCRSERCDTFMNEPLCPSEDFTCQVVEVFGFK